MLTVSRRMRQLRLAVFLALGACRRDVQTADSASISPTSLPALEGWGKSRPVDEASKVPGFAAFRDTMLAIAIARDSAALHARLSPTIKYSFGDSEGGPSGFFAFWRQHESMNGLWKTLTDVLQHGGRFIDAEQFYAPWTAGPFPSDSLDAFEFLFIRDSNVVVRRTSELNDPGFGTLSYDVIRSGADRSDSLWRGVRLRDGSMGYVEARHARSPIEYRMAMRRENGRWVIVLFVAGD